MTSPLVLEAEPRKLDLGQIRKKREVKSLTEKKKKNPQIGFKIKSIHWQGVQ